MLTALTLLYIRLLYKLMKYCSIEHYNSDKVLVEMPMTVWWFAQGQFTIVDSMVDCHV